MSSMIAPAGVHQSAVEAVIIRCQCSDPASHAGLACPVGIPVNLGTVAYYHRSPVLRFLYRVRRALGDKTFWR